MPSTLDALEVGSDGALVGVVVDPGVVDRHIDVTQTLAGPAREAFQARRVGDIERLRLYIRPPLGETRGGGLPAVTG